ncbi:hypothetical protein [Brevibacillus laterosporus]|uniref:hypothetical protein n=1 Tax=Brevibacillus laterosporus TaxID=1465 RepID=UPI000B9AEEF6|nr:hypothetical protein [Brevibacillus laterosporus]MBG9789644.1 hypothetical protein [Brevibacillus laterosporus]MCG7318586.1 hypothetical protein [Brevibacillus laterosporus]
MNNFIPVTVYPLYNGWTHPAVNYHVQQMREAMYIYSTREEVFDPERADVDTDDHGPGFKLYRWPPFSFHCIEGIEELSISFAW